MEHFYENLKAARKEKNLSQKEVAEAIGVAKSTYSLYESGKREPNVKTIKKIADFLGVSGDSLLGTVPVLGTVPGGEANNMIEYKSGDLGFVPSDDAEYFALQVSGNSMYPRIMDGDKVIVRKQTDFENGDIVIVAVNGYEATCKKILKDDKGITLIGTNVDIYTPHFYTKKEVESLPIRIIGKVVHVVGDV